MRALPAVPSPLALLLGLIGTLLIPALCCGLLRLPQQQVRRGVNLDGTLLEGFSRSDVEAHLHKLAAELEQLPRGAFIDPRSGAIVPEMPGRQLDIPLTAALLLEARANSRVLPVLVTLDPEITASHFDAAYEEIGSFRTWIGGGGNRAANIVLATTALNNYLLLPGEIFSFNTATGPRTAERGYRPAPVIVGHSVVPGLGGGICQVSTTLYNSVLRAGLEVVERYPHSQPIGYVPPGMDATVAESLDFRFRNSSDRLIMIRASNWGGSIDVQLWQD